MIRALERRLDRLEKRTGLDGELTMVIITHGYMPEACYEAWLEAEERKHRGEEAIILVTPAPGESCPVCGQVHETPEQHAERGRKAQEALRERINNNRDRL